METSKPQKPLGKNGYKYRSQFGVIVTCSDEQHQKQVYEQLKSLELQCKVVVV
jgi:hypothetical protein